MSMAAVAEGAPKSPQFWAEPGALDFWLGHNQENSVDATKTGNSLCVDMYPESPDYDVFAPMPWQTIVKPVRTRKKLQKYLTASQFAWFVEDAGKHTLNETGPVDEQNSWPHDPFDRPQSDLSQNELSQNELSQNELSSALERPMQAKPIPKPGNLVCTALYERWCSMSTGYESGEDDQDLPGVSPTREVQEPDSNGMWCACLNQCGYYPDEPQHVNQDTAIVHPITMYLGTHSKLLSVMDGHGPHGHFVSKFVADHLPRLAEEHLAKGTQPLEALVQAHEDVQDLLTQESEFDTVCSGTTAVSLWIGNRTHMFISNVGDSRAVLGKMRNSDVVAEDLTQDHTPFNPDERARVEAAGAHIQSAGEMLGAPQYGSDQEYTADDPPRCYMQRSASPGTAFTRSLGDRIAKTIGVIATPQRLQHIASRQTISLSL